MRTYTIVTGVVFALIVVAHIARVALEGFHVLKDPFFLGSSVLFTIFCGWSLKLLLRAKNEA
jgi:hypothetical protein